jgi:hypothetical protein
VAGLPLVTRSGLPVTRFGLNNLLNTIIADQYQRL